MALLRNSRVEGLSQHRGGEGPGSAPTPGLLESVLSASSSKEEVACGTQPRALPGRVPCRPLSFFLQVSTHWCTPGLSFPVSSSTPSSDFWHMGLLLPFRFYPMKLAASCPPNLPTALPLSGPLFAIAPHSFLVMVDVHD